MTKTAASESAQAIVRSTFPLTLSTCSPTRPATTVTRSEYSPRALTRAEVAVPLYTNAASPIPLTVPLSSARAGWVTWMLHGSSASGHSSRAEAGGMMYSWSYSEIVNRAGSSPTSVKASDPFSPVTLARTKSPSTTCR